MLLSLLACAGGAGPGGALAAAEPIGYYELGWPIDACSVDFPDEGTGYAEGDTLPQHTFVAQTGETVRLHDWCDHVVYIEIGFWT